MAANDPTWNSHEWETRSVESESRVPAIHYTCRNCTRQFLGEEPTGARYAVHVGITQFDRLSDDVTGRWLSEGCPGERGRRRLRGRENPLSFWPKPAGAKSRESSEGPEP
jgi:hypothetical protein